MRTGFASLGDILTSTMVELENLLDVFESMVGDERRLKDERTGITHQFFFFRNNAKAPFPSTLEPPKTLLLLLLLPLCFQNHLRPSIFPYFQTSKPPKPKPKPPDPTPNRNPTPIKSSLPFDFRHSYSETDPTLEPIGFREPKRFSPFGPGRLDREWTGTSAPVRDDLDSCLVEEERVRVLGDPLTEEEIEELVEK
ncbi:hypothetical protein Gotur_034418 [Gossypium turneri]